MWPTEYCISISIDVYKRQVYVYVVDFVVLTKLKCLFIIIIFISERMCSVKTDCSQVESLCQLCYAQTKPLMLHLM